MHNCVPNGTHKHENLDTIRHDNVLNVTTGANNYSTPIESSKSQKTITCCGDHNIMCKNLQVQTHFHTIEKPLHHPKFSVQAHFDTTTTTTTIANEPMLNGVGALKVHSHLVLGTLGLSPLTPCQPIQDISFVAMKTIWKANIHLTLSYGPLN